MSTLPDNELDLEKLFLPAWAQEPSASKYAKYEGETERPDRRGDRDRRGPRPPRRDGPPGPRRDGVRPGGDRRGPSRPDGAAPRPGFRQGDRPDPRRFDPRERRDPLPLPEIDLSLRPEEKGVESLARQIKMTGRAYPLFDIAQMILQKPERHTIVFSVKKNAEGKPVQPLLVCALDDTLWLSEDEAVAHVLAKHFGTFYQTERTATEPPKGKYTFVAQCGMSGVILGPPNHHDYQNALRKLHAERFSRMPFDAYKARVKIVRDEEVVKKWVDDQSWKTDYVCLNLPEAVRLDGMPAVEKHFRETHKDNIIKQVDTCTLNGAAARALRSPALSRLVRSVWEDQRRFPLQIATVLSQQFAGHGLQFFKVNKTLTHVSVARPHYLDLAQTPVSEGIRRIVEYINAHTKCNRRELIEALAPSPAPAVVVPISGDVQPAAAPEAVQATQEQTAVISDLHWLVHEGHVIEFANGLLETAKKPLPKPAKPEGRPAGKPVAPAAEAATAPSAGSAEPKALATPAPMADAQAQELVPPADELPAVDPENPAVPAPVADASPGTAGENAAVPIAGPVEPPS
ncbi:MAG: hypothetical protein WCL11_03885 [Verrucomicrobiota bacterium]